MRGDDSICCELSGMEHCTDWLALSRCGHRFSSPAWAAWIAAAAASSTLGDARGVDWAAAITCPREGCGSRLPVKLLEQFSPREDPSLALGGSRTGEQQQQ